MTDSTRGALSANAVSGEIVVRNHSGDLTLNTVSGDVTVRVPASEGVHVKANAVSGRLVVDGEEHGRGVPGSRTVDLRRGEGGSSLAVTTVSGDVTVLRGPAVTEAPAGGTA